ncbi:hypothetical protein ACHAWO_003724 [Cyclotella atomus]|uniref:Uncharacterized protein n=1 Tax=Cyclotella atomus TaxID=382360 RepID=A0ABD3P3D9_9STRA
MKSSILPLLTASTLPTASALSWSIDATSATCNGSPFSTDTISVTCNGSPSCTLGDTALITGNITAVTSFDASAYVILQPCILAGEYSYCPEKYSYSAGGICEEWLTPLDMNDCGEATDYSVDYSVTIPNKLPEYLSWLGYASSVVTVKVVVLTEEECQVEAMAEGGNGGGGYQMVYSMLGFTVGMVCAGAYARRKRVKSEEEKVEGQVQENCGGDYIEMLSGKGSSSVAVV